MANISCNTTCVKGYIFTKIFLAKITTIQYVEFSTWRNTCVYAAEDHILESVLRDLWHPMNILKAHIWTRERTENQYQGFI